MIQGYRMSLFKSKSSKSKLPNTKKIAEHSRVFCFKFNDICRQERHAGPVSGGGQGLIINHQKQNKKKMGLKHWIVRNNKFKTYLCISFFGWGTPWGIEFFQLNMSNPIFQTFDYISKRG